MRMSLLCLWTSWVLLLRETSSVPLEVKARTGWRRQGAGRPDSAPLLDGDKSGDIGGKPGAWRRSAVSGRRICGGACCGGWSLKTQRCIEARCPPCSNGPPCPLSTSCLCRQHFYGNRCQFFTMALPVGWRRAVLVHPTGAPPVLRSASPTTATRTSRTTSRPESDPPSHEAQAESSKEDQGGASEGFLPVEENRASTGSLGLVRTDLDLDPESDPDLDPDPDPDLEQRMASSEHPGTEARKENPSSLELKDDKGQTGEERRWEETKRRTPSLREAQSVLLRKTSSRGGRGGSMAALLMKHIRREKRKLCLLTSSSYSSSSSSSVNSRPKTFYSQKCQEDHSAAPTVLCPLLCKNGGICLQKDRCFCPSNFTGKFCQIPVSPSVSSSAVSSPSSTNEVVKPAAPSSTAANQDLMQSEFLLPLGQNQEAPRSAAAPGSAMVKVRVQHPPEASVKIHQVVKVPGSSYSPQMFSSSSSGSAGAPAPVLTSAGRIQAQTLRGAGTYNQQSGFKYCFREVRDGQCSSPLPGLRSREVCCKGMGKAWGITECVLCPEFSGQSNSSCPVGFVRSNGTQCVDVNECLQPGLCENGLCVNTRGSYSCVCRLGFILDATHGICISQSVISEEKSQCYRVLGSGRGPASCSLPIPRNITKQICCCSRVGKAWGPDCERCPYFGSVAFKEICPAGPGYQYSASTLQFSQRVGTELTDRKPSAPDTRGSEPRSSGGAASSSQQNPTSSGTRTSPPQQPPQPRPGPAAGSSSVRTLQPSSATTSQSRAGANQNRPNSTQSRLPPPSTEDRAGSRSSGSWSNLPPAQGDTLPVPAQPQSPGRGFRTDGQLDPPQNRPAVRPTRPTRVQRVCESRPGLCGRGLCVDQPGGKHTCECDQGHQPNAQRTRCHDVNECVQTPGVCSGGECVNSAGSFWCVCSSGFRSNNEQTSCKDIDECQQNPCSDGRCENTPGSYRCVCHHGYRLTGNTCSDVDECVDPLLCPGQECINTPGSYRCSSCQPGFGLLNGLCTDIDECRQAPCPYGHCENTPGSYRCVCRHGYKMQNNTCTDMDECAEPSQCPGQMCVNSVGSYRCVSCRPGYALTNRQCTDVDECARVGSCEEDRVCVNTIGSFRCDCPSGYRSSSLGRQCTDVNECLEGDFCFSRGECVNTPGSYMCVCSPGFTLSDNRTACLDVDECVKPGVCSDGRCINTEGSFLCECGAGFTTNPENTACLDLDECVKSGGSVCGSQRCENTIGSYRCLTSCEAGYQVAPDGSCADEDECVSKPDVCGPARCQNLRGSFECECDGAEEEFDSSSKQCVRPVKPGAGSSPSARHSSSSSDSSSSSSASTSFQASLVDVAPVLTQLPASRPGELRECYYNVADWGTCSVLATNTTQQECCCTMGEGWGLSCQYNSCPPVDTAEFLSLCPSGRGYITSGPGAFSYRDVDECKRFHPEVCKNGVCVNNIPGYSCYCSSGYVYNSTLLECVDHDECEEESCVGGVCVNTLGSYYCSCPPPLVLDDTQRICVNASHLTVDENLSVCWQHVTADLLCQSPLLGAQVTFVDCCCLYGEGWGMGCALCPPTDSEDYASLCSSLSPPRFSERFPDPAGSEPGAGRGGPPYGTDLFSPSRDFSRSDYDDYAQAGGSRSSFGGRAQTSLGLPEDTYRGSEYSTSYFAEGDYGSPDGSPPRTPSFRLPPDPRSEIGFGARPLPPSQPDLPSLNLAPLPGSPYMEEEEEEEEARAWRPGPAFPPFSDRSRGGGAQRRVYERRYEPYAGLNAAEDCGILHGCENGRCIRVAEGYTCDCYHGYELDMTSMTCVDINECEDGFSVAFPCVNARCVNTEGSFRCVCRRGYVMSRRLNHCIAA
ncbi:latent-transforming growth factor beta-binding protein 4 isoform X3 [Nothobranchius furzeri]|uniref:latent-transforming growth factor beta-binding protein 4 isoform X3 n=1 Tax=Nothobranchius furzeri TaxID=105023 RepID=UPI0024048418|nr:latent-transforming growth factor beta-binding protein 1 isoform X3 [Nothobranchius furzeri]